MKGFQSLSLASGQEIKDLLYKLQHNIKLTGTMQEIQLTRNLKSLNTGDKIDHLGGADQEDILITVRENKKNLGKIRVDSKKVKKWDNKFIDQMSRYLKSDTIDFGIIATTTMPKKASGSDLYWETDNIIVASVDVLEALYLACRYILVKSSKLSDEFDKKVNMLKEHSNKIKLLKDILERTSFKKHLEAISKEVRNSEREIEALENYFSKKITGFRLSNKKILTEVSFALDNDLELQRALASSSA